MSSKIFCATAALLACSLAAPLDSLAPPFPSLHSRSCYGNTLRLSTCLKFGDERNKNCLKVDDLELAHINDDMSYYSFTISSPEDAWNPISNPFVKCTVKYHNDPAKSKEMNRLEDCEFRDQKHKGYTVRAEVRPGTDIFDIYVHTPGNTAITFPLSSAEPLPCGHRILAVDQNVDPPKNFYAPHRPKGNQEPGSSDS